MQDTVVMMKESNLPQPSCLVYNMIVPWDTLNHCHYKTALCTRGVERNIQTIIEEEYHPMEYTAFRAYGQLL